ncbi:phosphoribosylamine--glycine ligase [Egibacter rhizosphaerae]|uniref:Phosphoribosylamine--glycine ligase n=1 Tax=Egibacter rhizosphaerae TaxID=1670831 RepID=A0A411YFX1_9ACTN|nr:phosphoribosylamine--glycine ligase [Egibacter rhizosphaerae]QBI20165.1 phosphoribosylamine--glycine ligase [Egibacter rhizosphaerae]
MKVLVLGGGGREHALCWALDRSPSVQEVVCAPGNPGIAEVADVRALDVTDDEEVVALARALAADLVVVGPEAPLVAGVADALRGAGVAVFGPSADAARLEGSKAFAKEVMAAAGVPTARWWTGDDAEAARAALDEFAPPYVVKADGLAAGKGVVIASSRSQAEDAVDEALVTGAFGEAGRRVVLEEFLQGPEVSLFGVADGQYARALVAAQDYKRIGDDDTGPNTGGMGAYSPVPALDDAAVEALGEAILGPVAAALAERGTPYVGVLYAGLVMTPDGPKVLEFNARFGDPEAQAFLPRLRADGPGDLGLLLSAAARGDLPGAPPLAWDRRACATVVLASAGYPASSSSGDPISGVREAAAVPDALVFHAGTAVEEGELVTAGGRVLSVSGLGATVAQARAISYQAADRIWFAGQQRREDIAARPLGG